MTSCKPVPLAFSVYESSQGTKESNPIIFLHGLSACKEHWADIPKKVAEATNRKVYAVDARNHGDSLWCDEFNFDINVLDLIQFIEQIAAEKVTIIGHSMGGVTSMKTALKLPSKVEKIIIEDMGIVIPKNTVSFIKMYFSFLQEAKSSIPLGLSRKEASKFINDFVFDRIPDEVKPFAEKGKDDKYSEFLKQNPDGTIDFRSNFNILRQSVENEDTLISEYEGIYNGPACFIFGKKSIFPVYQDAEIIRKFFPNAQFVGIEGATHDVHTDAPHLYVEALLTFLKE